MKSCPNHQKTLWLDVYGELAAEERPAWERHLKICGSCRLERQKLVQMLGGEIWVESPGYNESNLQGSRFYVRLPLTEWQEGKDVEGA